MAQPVEEHRYEQSCEARALYENVYNDPDEEIHLVTSHDPRQIDEYTRAGLIGEKFE